MAAIHLATLHPLSQLRAKGKRAVAMQFQDVGLNPGSAVTGSRSLGKFPNLSEPWFPHCSSEENMIYWVGS